MRLDIWSKAYSLLTAGERFKLKWIITMAVSLGIIEVVGVASVMPFIAVVVEPDLMHENRFLAAYHEFLGLQDERQFIIVLGITAFLLIVLDGALSSFSQWFSSRFFNLLEHRITTELLTQYLNRSYLEMLKDDAAQKTRNILSEVERVFVGSLSNGVGFLAGLVSGGLILSLLLYVDPLITLLTLVVLGGGYVGIYLMLVTRFEEYGARYGKLSTSIVKSLKYALDASKEIIVSGKQRYFVEQYRKPSYEASKASTWYATLTGVPETVLEVIAFGGLVLLALVFHATSENSGAVVASLALYAFAAYRLVPAIRNLYGSLEFYQFNAPVFDEIWEDLRRMSVGVQGKDCGDSPEIDSVLCRNGISLRDVRFAYPGSKSDVLRGVTVKFPANQVSCIVGASGAGKTTLVDLVMGLLMPDSGSVFVDKVEITDPKVLRGSVGYVPQETLLLEASIGENIAFGERPEAVDAIRLEWAASSAQLLGFIKNEVDGGFNAVLGQNGLRLSAGQRQRLGIARALYHDPTVLVLDEPTSSLDKPTAKEIMKVVESLGTSKTIILITHELWVAEAAHQVFELNDGKLSELKDLNHKLLGAKVG